MYADYAVSISFAAFIDETRNNSPLSYYIPFIRERSISNPGPM